MVRMGALQRWLAWMWLRVVPIQFLFPLPYFVSVRVDNGRKPIIENPLSNDQMNIVIEVQLTSNSSE
jgi:hypothetical protein